MKKLAALLLAIMVVFTLAGCDNGTATVDSSDGVSVEECYWSVIHSKSADEMAAYVSVGDANDYYGNVQNVFGSDTYSVKAEASGTQYIPNAYYDAGTGMWMGNYISCSGCGGSGHIGSSSFTPCDNCDGRRYVFEP